MLSYNMRLSFGDNSMINAGDISVGHFFATTYWFFLLQDYPNVLVIPKKPSLPWAVVDVTKPDWPIAKKARAQLEERLDVITLGGMFNWDGLLDAGTGIPVMPGGVCLPNVPQAVEGGWYTKMHFYVQWGNWSLLYTEAPLVSNRKDFTYLCVVKRNMGARHEHMTKIAKVIMHTEDKIYSVNPFIPRVRGVRRYLDKGYMELHSWPKKLKRNPTVVLKPMLQLIKDMLSGRVSTKSLDLLNRASYLRGLISITTNKLHTLADADEIALEKKYLARFEERLRVTEAEIQETGGRVVFQLTNGSRLTLIEK